MEFHRRSSLQLGGSTKKEARRVVFVKDTLKGTHMQPRSITGHSVALPGESVLLSPRCQQSPPRISSALSSRSMASKMRPRPRTMSAKFRSRRLGADIYPELDTNDLDREKSYFRSGIFLLSHLMSTTPRSLSARWRSTAPEGGRSTADTFCRSSRAESHLNNSRLARVYHVVPERVVSARAPVGGQSLLLQQLNQSLCDRRVSYANRIANAEANAEPEPKPVVSKEGSERDSVDSRSQSPLLKYRLNFPEHSAEWIEETKLKQEESIAILSQQLKSMLEGPPEEPFEGPDSSADRHFGTDESVKASNINHIVHAATGTVDNTGGCTPKGVTAASESELPVAKLETSHQDPVAASDLERTVARFEPTQLDQVSKSDSMTRLAKAKPSPHKQNKNGVCTAVAKASKLSPTSSADYSCRMRTMQCEVLGPYSCSDCTKIRLSERQQQEQRALFPGLAVHPSTLVAPHRLRRINATLPSALTCDKYQLDCGCAISLHRDFLFPVIVTDHDVHSRLMAAIKSRRLKTPSVGRPSTRDDHLSEASLPLGAGPAGEAVAGEAVAEPEGREVKGMFHITERAEQEEVSMSPADMKVTVRYNTPSPEHKRYNSPTPPESKRYNTPSPDQGGVFIVHG